MKLTRDQVEHIARLARLALTEGEVEQYATELSAILEYVNRLNELDTSGVKPTAFITESLAALRADEVHACDEETRSALVSAFPQSRADLLAVPAVFSAYKE